jgi:spore maturation protein CgeB
LVPGSIGHVLRREVIEHLMASGVPIEMYAHVLQIKPLDLFLRQSAYLVFQLLKRSGFEGLARSLPAVQKASSLQEMPRNMKHVSEIIRTAKPSIYGLEMFKVTARAKIGFNAHGNVAGDYAANMRLFEITGAGSCMVTDMKSNLHELFEIDGEVVAYTSAEECVEKVRWLLDHPSECAAIALRGQQRTCRDHSYEQRAENLHRIIESQLKAR